MSEAVKMTIEEWAGDNNILLTDEQIDELSYAIDVAKDMERPCGYGIDQYQNKEKLEIKQLKNQIDMLLRYINSKGYHINLHDNKITRMYMINDGDRSFSRHEEFR